MSGVLVAPAAIEAVGACTQRAAAISTSLGPMRPPRRVSRPISTPQAMIPAPSSLIAQLVNIVDSAPASRTEIVGPETHGLG